MADGFQGNKQSVETPRLSFTEYPRSINQDISMCYYTFELEEDSQELCTINTPFGKFTYQRLTMGLSCSPDHCQEIMEEIFNDIEECDVFIDDIDNFSNNWEQHLRYVSKHSATTSRLIGDTTKETTKD